MEGIGREMLEVVQSTLTRLPNVSSLLRLLMLLSPLSINEAPQSDIVHQCPGSQLSCRLPTAPKPDTCCVNHPSGLFLQTQFWDTSPSVGPANSWTIHGLWPDLCTGGFDQYCDENRVYNNISDILNSHGGEDTLEYMKTYWLSDNGNDEHLWTHEWNKHGTCISTLASPCYPSTSPFDDVLDYFTHTTLLFDNLNTYDALATVNIYPSKSKTYNLADILAPLELLHSYPVILRCKGHELNEIWYFFNTEGSLRNATGQTTSPFIPRHPGGQTSNCPAHGIKYLPKGANRVPIPLPKPSSIPLPKPTATSTTTHTNPPPSSTPFSGRGHLAIYIQPSNVRHGCLIRHGEWYTSGSCAVFHGKADVVDPNKQTLFSLSSSFAPCAIDAQTGVFQCAKNLGVQGIFSGAGEDGMALAYRNETRFWAERVPRKFGREGVFAGDGEASRGVEVEVRWEAVG